MAFPSGAILAPLPGTVNAPGGPARFAGGLTPAPPRTRPLSGGYLTFRIAAGGD